MTHPETVRGEEQVLGPLTEAVADFLDPFCRSLGGRPSEEKLRSPIDGLRGAFDNVVSD